MFPFVYVQDKKKFAALDGKKKALLSLDQLAIHLKSYDPKFHDTAILDQTINDLMDSPISSADLEDYRHASAKKKAVNLGQVWAELAPLVRLYKRINASGQEQIFYISETNEVTKVDYVDGDSLVNALMYHKQEFKPIEEFYQQADCCQNLRDKMGLKTFLIKVLTEYMMVDSDKIIDVDPIQISWNAEDYAYKKMDSSLLKPGPTPTWDEFTSRLDYPAVFMAWVWSIFEPTNNIRQVMWLKGVGNDGKSSVQKAIESVIGRNYCYSMKPGDEMQQWFQKNVFGKVLVNYADCRNPHLIDNNNVKQLTGGDTTSIEGKGENSFTGKIYSKLLVTSNIMPRINPEIQAHTSRLIKVEVAPLADSRKDSGFEKRLQQEIYAFLYSCQQAFNVLISNGYDKLDLPKELVEKMTAECASETYLNVQDFCEEYIEFSDSELCDPAELKRTAKDYFLNRKNLSAQSIAFHMTELEVKFAMRGCSLFRHDLGTGSQMTMWRGFKLKMPDKSKLKLFTNM